MNREGKILQALHLRLRLGYLFFCFFLARARKGKIFGVLYLNLYINKPPRFELHLLEKLVRKISGTFAGKITDKYTEELRR